jgi:hypothetical protein
MIAAIIITAHIIAAITISTIISEAHRATETFRAANKHWHNRPESGQTLRCLLAKSRVYHNGQ